MPCSSARSCSSASARSIAVCGSAASRSRQRAAIDVQADVAPGRRLRLTGPRVGDGRAREIQREAVPIDDHLGHVRVAGARRRRRCVAAACSSSSDASLANGATAASIISGSRSGSSPCTFTMRSQVERRGRLPPGDRCRSDAPATSSPLRRRNRRTTLGDPLIVGGDDHARDRPGRGGATVDVLDHRPAGNVGERFARKTSRVIPRGDDGDCGE